MLTEAMRDALRQMAATDGGVLDMTPRRKGKTVTANVVNALEDRGMAYWAWSNASVVEADRAVITPAGRAALEGE